MKKFMLLICCLLVAAALLVVRLFPGPMAAQSQATRPTVTQPLVIAPVPDRPASPVVPEAAQNLPASQPAGSVLLIGQKRVAFGSAMLRLTENDKKVVAQLYSDAPQSVLTGSETADTYDFQMTLPDIDRSTDIGSAVWTYKCSSSERQDSPYGIFLNKEQRLLQPKDVAVRFEGQAPQVRVMISGWFSMYRMSQEVLSPAPEGVIWVEGSAMAKVPEK